MSGSNDDNLVNRRKVIKGVAASSLVGSTGLVGTAGAKTQSDEIEIRKEKTDVSRAMAEKAVESTAGESLLGALEEPSYDLGEAVQINNYIEDELISYVVQIPTDYGELEVGYDETNLIYGGVKLEREDIPQDVRAKLSRSINWPANADGILSYKKRTGDVQFCRSVTRTERESIESLTQRAQETARVGARRTIGKPDGEFIAAYSDEVYHLNRGLSKVVEVEETVSSGDPVTVQGKCSSKGGLCVLDIIAAAPHCTAGGIACGIAGPATPACVTAVLAYCLPNVALVAVSGNCTYYAKNCL